MVLDSNKGRLYVGTIRTISTTQVTDTRTQRFVWNYYNRLPKCGDTHETASSWTTSTASTWRATNGDSTEASIEFLIGIEDEIFFELTHILPVFRSSSGTCYAGIGTSTSANIAQTNTGAGPVGTIVTSLAHYSGVNSSPGLQTYYMLENPSTTGFTCYGTTSEMNQGMFLRYAA